MWKELYPALKEHQIPIGHITNGVHAPSWMHPRMQRLLDRCSPGWRDGVVPTLRDVSYQDLWAIRNDLRASLLQYARRELGREEWLSDDT